LHTSGFVTSTLIESLVSSTGAAIALVAKNINGSRIFIITPFEYLAKQKPGKISGLFGAWVKITSWLVRPPSEQQLVQQQEQQP
jgi:hypothetical protein